MHKHTFARFLVGLSTILSTLVLARSASADTINLTWDPNPEPQVIGYVVHVGTQSGSYSQHIDVGPTTAWSFTSAVAGQQYCFAVTAYITGPLEGPGSTEACGFSNAPPALVNPGAQSSTVGQAASLQLAGTDPKGDPLTYSATGLPPGLTVMASTGYISGTPTTAGSYTVNARVSDNVLTASRTFTWTVGVVDTVAPVVTITGPTTAATFATTTATLALSGTASDNVGVTQVSWVNNRGGSGTATGTTNWSRSVALLSGSNVVTVTARDAAGNTSTDVLTVTYNAPDATAPVVTITGPTTAATFTTTTATLALSGTLSDNVGVTQVSWVNNRGGSGTATGTTNWSRSVALLSGSNVVTVTARDAAGNTSTDVLTVTYNAPDATAPVVTITGPTTAATFTTTTATLALSGTASDNVGVTQVSWVNNRGGSGTATGTTNWSRSVVLLSGSNVVTVTARDAAGNTSTDVLTVTYTAGFQVRITTNRTSPQKRGTYVEFTATATGGETRYKYMWRIFDGETWTTLQEWRSDGVRTATWRVKAGSYLLEANVRDKTGAIVTTTIPFEGR